MKARFLVGISLLVLAAGVIAAYFILTPPPVTTVYGYIGGSKANLMEDPDVKKILHDKFQLDVEYVTLGGLEQVCNVQPIPGAALPGGYDFLWPGTDLSIEEYKSCHGGIAKYASLLLSPVIIYSWESITEPLAKSAFIEKISNGYYTANMEKLGPVLIDAKTPWPEGIQTKGKMEVRTSDPKKSNGGQVFGALLAKLLQQQRNVTFKDSLPEVKEYFDSLGFMEPSTKELFDKCLVKGPGSCPLFWAYESFLPDFVNDNKFTCDNIKALKAIYPDPTIWATHPFIAETANGAKLLAALQDGEIQTIAAERHGFRSILGKMANIDCLQTAQAVNGMPLPTKPEMDALDACLKNPKC